MLSKKSQYAIHAIQLLAEAAPGQLVTIQAIADKKGIPKKFLEYIMLKLRDAGIIASKRGKEGGYLILKKLDEITLADIVIVMDKSPAFLPCLREKTVACQLCRTSPEPCTIRDSIYSIQQ